MEISTYVDAITTPLQRVAALLNERVASGALPAVSRLGLWSAIVSHVLERFVEAFSRVKRCTVPGRGLMTLDIGHTYACATRCGPTLPGVLSREKSYADAYVSAYYLESESDVLTWIVQQRSAYPLRLMRALLTNGPVGAKNKGQQARQLTNAIDAMYVLPREEGPGAAAVASAALASGIAAATGLSVPSYGNI